MLMVILSSLKQRRSNQAGLASIVVVSVLVVVLSLIAIGFSRDMNRAVQQSANAGLGTAATYAARSGINDAIAYLKANPATAATSCSQLLTDTISPGDKTKILANLSGDSVTQYTCLLIDPKPTDLVYQKVSSLKSQVVRVNPTANLSKMMVSWQANDRTNVVFPAAGGTSLLDETVWGTNKNAPVLRVSLYAVPSAASGLNNVISKTFFFYPNQAASLAASVSSIDWSSSDGTLKSVACNNSDNATLKTDPSVFSGSADYDCNIIITNLPNTPGLAPYYYVSRITPIYATSDVKIKGVDASNKVQQLVNTQAIVDVTAKSGSATKRLQARVDIATSSGVDLNISSLDDVFPEYAIRSSGTLCKQLQILDPSADLKTDPATKSDCSAGASGGDSGGSPIKEQSPPIPTTGIATDITTFFAKLNGTIDVKGANVKECYFKFGTPTGGYTSNRDCVRPLPTADGGDRAPVSVGVSGLEQYTEYIFELCATNSANDWPGSVVSCGERKNFRTKPVPPTVTIAPPSTGVHTGAKVNLNWSTSPSNPGTTCNPGGQWAGLPPAASGGRTDTFNTVGDFTYTVQCTGPEGVVGNVASTTISVTNPPPPTVVIRDFRFAGYNSNSASFIYDELNGSDCSITMNYSNPGGSETKNFQARPSSGAVPYDPTTYIFTSGEIYPGRSAQATLNCTAGGGATPGRSGPIGIPAYRSPSVAITGVSAFVSVYGNSLSRSCANDGNNSHYWFVCVSWSSSAVEPGDSVQECKVGANSTGSPYYQYSVQPPSGGPVIIGSTNTMYYIYVACYSRTGGLAGAPGTTSRSLNNNDYTPLDSRSGGGSPAPAPAPAPAPLPGPAPKPAPAPKKPPGGGGCAYQPGSRPILNYGIMMPPLYFGRVVC